MDGGSGLRAIGRAGAASSGGRVVGKGVLPPTVGRRPAKPSPSIVSVSSASAAPPSSSAPSTVASCESGTRFSLRPDFELPPSEEEAEAAISILKQIFVQGIFYNASENGASYLDKKAVINVPIASEMISKVFLAEEESNRHAPQLHLEKAMQCNSLKELQSQRQNILNLFSLLHLNPRLQRIVVSLSSDKAIWDAVMKNEAVRELKESFLTGCHPEAGGSQCEFLNGVSDIATIIVSWILDNIKTKVMGLIDKITQLVDELFHSAEKAKSMDVLDDILRSLFMLSLMVSIVVVITRIQRLKAH